MSVNPPALLFFDASCLIAASASPRGGSAVLVELCRRGWLRGAISHVVQLEAERNIVAKLGSNGISRYRRLFRGRSPYCPRNQARPNGAAW